MKPEVFIRDVGIKEKIYNLYQKNQEYTKHYKPLKKVKFLDKGDMSEESHIIDSESKESFAARMMIEKGNFSKEYAEASKKLASMKPPKSSQTRVKQNKTNKKKSCFTCHQKGHVASCCPIKKDKRGTSPVKSKPEVKRENSPPKPAQKPKVEKVPNHNQQNGNTN
ncbi:MAG: hypothetical protein Q8755_03370, partial [Candidatus Phytoplasma australasiaticum]|nr:hypothetical protein [Candidatus Phytoplasma australasiaticum]